MNAIRNEPSIRSPRRVAVVTGSASGLGRATTQLLHDAGWYVVGWDASETAGGIDAPLDAVARFDISEATAVAAAAERQLRATPEIGLLVNAAGILVHAQLADISAEQMHRLFAVNVIGTTLVTQALLPGLSRARGAVVNVASNTAVRAVARNAHYSSSKAALLQLTRSWALELRDRGIRVNAVCPGALETNLFAAAGVDAAAYDLLMNDVAARTGGRVGTTSEVAEWIVRLGAEDSWVTGSHLVIDGGSALAG